jgi:predicted NBD/HSP70 family sugar kinase
MSTVLVVDIGGTSVKIGFIVDDEPHEYVRRFSTDELRSPDPAAVLARMISVVTIESGLKPEAIVSTVPGFLDARESRILHAANIPELDGCLLANALGQLTGLPVVLERDAVLALIGEYVAGVCQGANAVLGLFFGTGVGAAFLQNGLPFRGSGSALEIGHMPFRGARRWVGSDRSECLEAYVSGKALEHIAEHHQVSIGDVFTASAQKPELANDLREFVRNQASAVATAVAILSPETIVLGGGICEMHNFPKAQLASELEERFPFVHTGRPLDLRWTSLGWRSVLHGASFSLQNQRQERQSTLRGERA